VKIDWKKEISMPKLRRPAAPKLGRGGEKASPSSPGAGARVPKPLVDLYWDLRDRHLLPVIGLLIVAMAAAPILLSGKGGGEEEVTPVASAPGGSGKVADATFDVVPAGSSLRDYKKRLGHREAVNPFRGTSPGATGSSSSSGSDEGSQEPGSGQESEASSSSSEETVTGTTETTESVVTTTVGGVTTEVPGGAPEPAERGHDAKEAEGGSKSKESNPTRPTGPKRHRETGGEEEAPATPTPAPTPTPTPSEPTTPAEPSRPSEPAKPAETTHTEGSPSGGRETSAPPVVVGYTIDAEAGFLPHATEKTEIAPLTKLPNARHPVVVFMGLSQNHKRALFLMTGEVTAWYGGHCALDKQACQLIEVGAGKGATFAYGYGDSRYKVRVKKIVPTLVRPGSSGR
jgi:hypothetical protein